MIDNFPIHYTLESGTQVTVNRSAADTYDFDLMPTEGTASPFTYVEGQKTKSEWDHILNFEQLEALRKFWLMNEEIV